MTETEIQACLIVWEKRLQVQIQTQKADLEADIVALQQKIAELEYQIQTLQTGLLTT